MFSTKTNGEVINLGNPNEITVLDLAAIIIKQTDSKSRIIFKKLPRDDPAKRKPDITKAIKLLGWKPKIDIVTGTKSTIEYFESLS